MSRFYGFFVSVWSLLCDCLMRVSQDYSESIGSLLHVLCNCVQPVRGIVQQDIELHTEWLT